MKWITRLMRRANPEPDAHAQDAASRTAPAMPASTSASDCTSAAASDSQCAERISALTPREREVFSLLVQGNTMREAAEALGVKQTTISFHSTALYKKLGVHNRAQLILRYGLIEHAKNMTYGKGAEVD